MKRRTHNCGELTKSQDGKHVVLQGWVGSRRDLGGLIFLGLRDRFGVTQVVVNPKVVPQEVMKAAEGLRYEFVIEVEGKVGLRPEGQANGGEWRTAPLWGIGLTPEVSGHSLYLHDGRARNLLEAILWHGGEAKPARDRVVGLQKQEREHLLRFIESL